MRRVLAFVLGVGAAGCFSEFGIDEARFADADGTTTSETASEVVTATETAVTETAVTETAVTETAVTETAVTETGDDVEHETEGETEDDVEHETEDEIEGDVEHETEDDVEGEVDDDVEHETEDDVEGETGDDVEDETGDDVEDETGDDVEDDTILSEDADVVMEDDTAADALDAEVMLGCPEDPGACPAGDRCDSAVALVVSGSGLVVTEALDASFTDDYPIAGGCGGLNAGGPDRVWRLTFVESGDWTITATGAGTDVVLYRFADGTCADCAEVVDEAGVGGSERLVARGLGAGAELLVVADTPGAAAGTVTLEVRREVEDCELAEPMTRDRVFLVGDGDLGDPTLTDDLAWGGCGVAADDSDVPNVVFELVVPYSGQWSVVVSPDDAGLDPRWQVRSGAACASSICLGARDASPIGEPERGEVTLVGGEIYWLVVDSAAAPTLDGGFIVEVQPGAIDRIAEARAALAAGTTAGSWLVDGAVVVAKKPVVGTDPSGFVLQASPSGPALLIETTTPDVVAIGDVVSVTVETLRTFFGASTASTWSGLVVHGATDLTGWAQDISAIDPVAALAELEQELVDLDGVVAALPTDAGNAHIAFNVATAGFPIPTVLLRVRLPAAGFDGAPLVPGCDVSVRGGFLWRFNTTAQPSTYDPAALAVTCPPIQVVRAAAAATDAVRVYFDRAIDPASIAPDGSQFTFDPVLTTASAVAETQSVLVTLTSSLADVDYLVTVATDVLDSFGDPIDPDARTAAFTGFTGAYGLVINEVDYDQSAGGDTGEFIEIFNGTPGEILMGDYALELTSGSSVYATLPLSGSLPAGGYLVIARMGMSVTADVVLTFETLMSVGSGGAVQNGPDDGVRLVTVGGVRVDSLLYEGTAPIDGISEGAPFAGGEINSDPNLSVQRCPNGIDLGDNSKDFVLGLPTPGASNCR